MASPSFPNYSPTAINNQTVGGLAVPGVQSKSVLNPLGTINAGNSSYATPSSFAPPSSQPNSLGAAPGLLGAANTPTIIQTLLGGAR